MELLKLERMLGKEAGWSVFPTHARKEASVQKIPTALQTGSLELGNGSNNNPSYFSQGCMGLVAGGGAGWGGDL